MVLLVRPGSDPVHQSTEETTTIRRNRRTEKLEVSLSTDQLVEADVGLDGDTRTGISQIRITTRDDGEAFSLRLP